MTNSRSEIVARGRRGRYAVSGSLWTALAARLLLLFLVLGAVAGCATPATAPPGTAATEAAPAASAVDQREQAEDSAEPSLELDAALPSDPAVRVGRLENGLRYYVRSNSRPEDRAELRLVVGVGSTSEDPDQLGLAHFLEHMAFNGTENFAEQELVDYLESIGMRFGPDLNAYTSFDETVYMLQVPTDDGERLETGLAILEEWAGAITLDEEEIDKERGVVLEEWRLGRGAGARVRDQQFPVLFRGSRYAERLPIGDPEILRGFSPEALRRFYRDWYRPELMAVVAVGDFDAAAVEREIRQRFASLSAAEDPRPPVDVDIPGHDETLVSVVSDPELTTTSIAVNWKYRLQPSDTVRDYRRSLVETLFNLLLNQRLDELAQAPDPPFLGASSSEGAFNREIGLYSLSAVVETNGVERGLGALLEEAERVRQHGFTPGELERAKSQLQRLYRRFFEEREKTESSIYAAEYVRNFLEGEAFPGIAYELALVEEYLPGIELAEVDAMAHRFMSESDRVVLATFPDTTGVVVPAESDLVAMVDRAAAIEVEPWVDRVADRPLLAEEPEPGEIVARRPVEELGALEWQLSNGIEVVLKATDFKNDEILFTAFSPGGHSLVEDSEWPAAITASGIVGLGGLGGLDLIELQKELAGKVVRVSPFIGEMEEGMAGGGSPEDLELLFQLIHLYATEPRCDPEAYASWRSRMAGLVENRRQQPEVVFGEEITRILSDDHPRRQPFDEELLKRTSLELSCAIFEQRFADLSDFTFVFVGALDPVAIEPLVERYLASLPDLDRAERGRDVGVEFPSGLTEHTVRMGLEPKAQVRLFFSGPFEQSVQERFDFQTMLSLLRLRLRETLREEMGGTYGVSVSGSTSFEPRQEYTVSIGFGTDPGKVEELVAAVFDEIDGVKGEPATELELTKLREQLRRERETALETNGFWLSALESVWQRDLEPEAITGFEQRVEALDAASLQEAARRYLDRENHARFVLLPEEEPETETEPTEEGDDADP